MGFRQSTNWETAPQAVWYDEILFWTVTQAPQVGSSIKKLKLKKFKL